MFAFGGRPFIVMCTPPPPQVRRLIANPAVKHSFSQLLQRGGANKDSKDRVLVAQLADLLEKVCHRVDLHDTWFHATLHATPTYICLSCE